MAHVNPPLREDNAPYNPVNHVTGVFDAHDQVTLTLRDLAEAGFARDDIYVFSGEEGQQALDPSGDAMGAAGRLFRKLENPALVKSLRRDIARIKTLQTERSQSAKA